MYKIEILPPAKKDLDSLENRFFTQVKNEIIPLASNPRPHGFQKLTADEGYRIRSGNYRILYRVDDKNKIIYIYRIKHRKESYR